MILRTEVKSKAVVSSAKKGDRYFVNDDHTQRHTLALRDGAYLIEIVTGNEGGTGPFLHPHITATK